MSEELQVRVHGDAALPALIYLPGLHGDWTLVGGFRRAVSGRVRFVELTYPRTLDWSLQDYAQAIELALAQQGLTHGWLIGESFGSQVLWALVGREKFASQAAILAGGFIRYPMRWAVRAGQRVGGRVPLALVTRILFGYAKVARFRFRHAPETVAGIHEFIARRTELDRQAAVHRLQLIAQNDPCAIARQVKIPVYALSGLIDPLVPWFCVQPWLKKNCLALRDYKIIRNADHNVLGTAPQAAAQQVLQWMGLEPAP
jgi:pimeloyl-ACP methyl ester carboxylesterase